MKHIASTILLFLLTLQFAGAQSKHEIRMGWGDQMFEKLVWRNGDYRRTQHWFAEYSYKLGQHTSIGCMADFSGVLWDNTTSGSGEDLSREKGQYFYNICAMPVVKFNYFQKKYVSFYSGIGAGINVNTGTETDIQGRKTAVAPAFYFDVFSVKAQYGRFFGTVDFGGLFSLSDATTVYMAGSRMFSVGIGINL